MMPLSLQTIRTGGYGLGAILDELESQGISASELLRHAGIRSVDTRLTQAQRTRVLRSAYMLSPEPLTAISAGKRQRIHQFGVYGFALATSTNLGEAFAFGMQHLDLSGAVLRISFNVEKSIGVLRSHNPHAFGDLLQFIAEFWRSSMVSLLGEILEDPFPSILMRFPYPRPKHADAYNQIFNCKMEFDSPTMEWHFDANVLTKPCPSANSVTTSICQEFCHSIISDEYSATGLQRELRSFVLANSARRITAKAAAQAVGLSQRTLFRRLADERVNFPGLVDQIRASLACEYLKNTRLTVTEISARCGSSDEANFRKAFARWKTTSPSLWRASHQS